jgi:hypothetical protein
MPLLGDHLRDKSGAAGDEFRDEIVCSDREGRRGARRWLVATNL